MATYKKTAAKKPVAVKTQPEVVETATPVEETVNKIPQKAGFQPTDPILCRSITAGYLAMKGLKTQINYVWANYNDETEVEYQDLVSAVRGSYSQVFEPLFIIENDDFLKEFPQLEKLYVNIYKDNDFDEILRLPVDEMIDTISHMPAALQDSMKSVIGDQVRSGALDSMRRITALENLYKTDFLILRDNS